MQAQVEVNYYKIITVSADFLFLTVSFFELKFLAPKVLAAGPHVAPRDAMQATGEKAPAARWRPAPYRRGAGHDGTRTHGRILAAALPSCLGHLRRGGAAKGQCKAAEQSKMQNPAVDHVPVLKQTVRRHLVGSCCHDRRERC